MDSGFVDENGVSVLCGKNRGELVSIGFFYFLIDCPLSRNPISVYFSTRLLGQDLALGKVGFEFAILVLQFETFFF